MKPLYAEGQAVAFEEGTLKGHGRIRGLASSNTLLDMWIVEIVEAQGLEESYPWSHIALPHGCLRALPERPSDDVCWRLFIDQNDGSVRNCTRPPNHTAKCARWRSVSHTGMEGVTGVGEHGTAPCDNDRCIHPRHFGGAAGDE